MKNMTKREQILALKTIEARKVKQSRPHTVDKQSSLRQSSQQQNSLSPLDFSTMRGYNSSSAGGPNQGSFSPNLSNSFSSSRDNVAESIRSVQNKINETSLTESELALSKELSLRGLTQEAYVRKITNEALARAHQLEKANANDDVDIFIPKVRKVRPDGATLAQVYESKREDIWGKILKQQVLEEDQNNIGKKIQKEMADAEYGKALRQQLKDREAFDKAFVDRGEVLANARGHWDQFEIRNRTRIAEKSKNHSVFVSNALEDMAKKRKQKNDELQRELEASAYLTRKAAQAQVVENEKLAQQRKAQAAEQNRLLLENFALLEKRQNDRQMKHDEDRKYVREMDEKFQREEERRKAEVDRKASTNSLDRGAYVVASKVYEEKMKNTESFFKQNESSTNLLNVTLQASEQETHERMERSKKSLKDEFAIQRKKNAENRDDRGIEIAEQRKIINAAQKKYHDDVERERQEKVKAASNYQRLLDAQLKAMRQRSLHALEETMAPKEKDMNSLLLKKYGIPVKK